MGAEDIIVGIDLGTTNSLVAVYEDAGPRTLVDERGEALLPSVVRFEDDGRGGVRAVVGRVAAEQAVEFPRTTVSSVKRLMGRSLADAAEDLPYLSYRVVQGEHETARVAVPVGGGERIASAQEVSAIILRELAERAGRELGVPVRRAVVTVPAYFDDAQRQATRDAGRLAGLEVVRIVNEPTAAALAYGLGLGEQRRPLTVAVFDLGGGTFDISILRITPNPGGGEAAQPAFFQVLATAGDTHLGGDDVDHALVRMLAGRMRGALGVGSGTGRQGESERARQGESEGDPLVGLDASTRRALKQFAQAVKHRLSEEERASVRIEASGAGVFETTVTREEIEALMERWVERAIACCRRAVADAGIDPGAFDAVIMVGGATRTPLVRRRVRELFGLEPYTALDPDRVVALGAAVQAAIMSGRARGALLLDVIPLSLGIETAGGAVAKLIMRNSTVPARATEMFTTSVDGQTSIKIHVVQGEREMVEHCRSLGVFDLRGLPPMPAGVPQLGVEFLVDAGGVLRVTATERRTGKRAQLQVVPNHGLTREEVERIEAESFAHAREDMTRHRVVDLVVNSKLDLKWIGDQLDRHGPALEAAPRAELEQRIAALRGLTARAEADWRSVSADELHRAKEALDLASVRLQEIAIAASLRGS
ncbi:MAG TPA: Hsp70 family protein [Phycisphaerales bacterium]|nr:Hsp70 family protein [Phycisphaerales bacterium]